MALSQKSNISKVKLTNITDQAKEFLKLILNLFGVKFKIEKIDIDEYSSKDNSIISNEDELDEEFDSDNNSEISANSDKHNLDSKNEIDKCPSYFLIFSCLGCNLDNKNRVEGW